MKTDSGHQPYLEPVYRLFIKVLFPPLSPQGAFSARPVLTSTLWALVALSKLFSYLSLLITVVGTVEVKVKFPFSCHESLTRGPSERVIRPRSCICKLGIYCKNYTVIWLVGVPVTVILTLAALEPTDNNGRGRLS